MDNQSIKDNLFLMQIQQLTGQMAAEVKTNNELRKQVKKLEDQLKAGEQTDD